MRVEERPATEIKQELVEDEPTVASSPWMAKPVESSQTVADAIASLPQCDSLMYTIKNKDAGRKARPSSPTLREGDDDPIDDCHAYLPWEQGIWEGEDDGLTGANFGKHYQRDKNVVDEIPKIRTVWAARGGRSYEAATKKKYRQCARHALAFNFKSVQDRFHPEPTIREGMIRNGWRSEAVGRIDREAKEYLKPGHRSYQVREKYEGGDYRSDSAGKTVSWAYKSCQARDSASNYWKTFNSGWREWAGSQPWQAASSWERTSPGWGSGEWHERWEAS